MRWTGVSRHVPLVATNGNYMPDIAIIFDFGDIDSEDLAATDLPTPFGPCQIQVYDLIAKYIDASPKQASQVIAHEIYYCIQYRNQGDKDTGATKWVIEGSAEHFSNLVFPEADLEHLTEDQYDPTAPIYKQKQEYETSLFFQKLEWTKHISCIHKWVMDTSFEEIINEEQTRLSKLPDFLDEFYLFAKDFSVPSPFSTSGATSILDTEGDFIAVKKTVVPNSVALTFTNEDETSGKADLRVVPFTITVFSSPLDPGQIVTVSAAIKPSDRAAYRLAKDTVWGDLPVVAGEHSKAFITVGCDDTDPVVDILSMFQGQISRVTMSLFQSTNFTNLNPSPANARLENVAQVSRIALLKYNPQRQRQLQSRPQNHQRHQSPNQVPPQPFLPPQPGQARARTPKFQPQAVSLARHGI